MMMNQNNLRLKGNSIKAIKLSEFNRFGITIVYAFGLKPLWRHGFYILIKRIRELVRKNGWDFTRDYLKESSRILLIIVSGEDPTQGIPWVGLTRSGIPRIIPKTLRDDIRLFISFPDVATKGYRVLRATLSILSI